MIIYGLIYKNISLSFSLSLQASVSLKRLRVFLSHEELEEDSVDRRAVTSCKQTLDDSHIVFALNEPEIYTLLF